MSAEQPNRCPAGHGAGDDRWTHPPGEHPGPTGGVDRQGRLWRLHSLDAARTVLRARHQTTQAGFSAERIPTWLFARRPILIGDGPQHDEQRRAVARFLAPAVVSRDHRGDIEASAARRLDAIGSGTEVHLDDLALQFSVEVTCRIVGLTRDERGRDQAWRDRRTRATARRLAAFFDQPPLDMARDDLGRTQREWARAARAALGPLLGFHLADVLPAIRERRRAPRDDIISHLIGQGLDTRTILVEALTYGTAGMVTTREFICLAAWHLLRDDDLRAHYRAADEAGRHAVLHELLRLEPVVGHLYRRLTEPLEVDDAGRRHTIPAGAVVDVCVRDTNTDPAHVGADPLTLCPERATTPGVNPTVLAFGDGAHKCPGQPLAVLEADVLLTGLLDRNPVLVGEPGITWNDLVAGYQVRDMVLRLDAPADRPET